MRSTVRGLLALAAVLASLGILAGPAWGASGDPQFTFVPTPAAFGPPVPAPAGYLIGPCGLAVDSSGNFYVSDYYHHVVDIYSGTANYSAGANGSTGYVGQVGNQDPLDGPCGLAIDSSSRLYVNNFDRNVVKGATIIAGAGVDEARPTGVAVDPATNDVYVDDRTYVTGYDSSGSQLLDAGEPLKIGEDPSADYYGLAIDALGRLYVADAADDTVKVYDPSVSTATPELTITGPPGGFTSLRQAALAVDRVSGRLYVIDNLQPFYTEKPRAQVEAFGGAGAFLGVLKYQVVDALPSGLAVDNSAKPSQGRVYVTSGNTDQAAIYAYAPGSQIASSSPPSVGLAVKAAGTGGGAVTSSLGGIDCVGDCSAQIRSGASVALSAAPDPGSTFSGWSGGGCSGTGDCTVTMDEATSVEADFEALPAPRPELGPSSTETPGPPAPEGSGRASARRHRHRHRHRHRRPHRHRRGGRR